MKSQSLVVFKGEKDVDVDEEEDDDDDDDEVEENSPWRRMKNRSSLGSTVHQI
jgi:hypothetical protein